MSSANANYSPQKYNMENDYASQSNVIVNKTTSRLKQRTSREFPV